jgi:DNA-binding transcriptional LysR family regulator
VIDGVSLDQLRIFIAAVDEGSFSAAARKLLRAQSVISETVSNLEDQIGIPLFDRSGRYPKLTPGGAVLLADARSIVTGVDLLKARAKGMAVGLEPELSVVVDVFYPIDAITQVAKEFREHYPGVALRIYVEALGAAIQPVLDGRCSVGIVGSLPAMPGTLTNERLRGVSYLMVAARDHPLTLHKGNIPREVLGKFTQIVLTDRSELSAGRELGVMSPTTWRLADLFAKHHFLLNGLGWGGMPLHAVRKDLEEGRRSPHRGCTAGRLERADVGCLADQITAWACGPLVYRALEGNSGARRRRPQAARRYNTGSQATPKSVAPKRHQ